MKKDEKLIGKQARKKDQKPNSDSISAESIVKTEGRNACDGDGKLNPKGIKGDNRLYPNFTTLTYDDIAFFEEED